MTVGHTDDRQAISQLPVYYKATNKYTKSFVVCLWVKCGKVEGKLRYELDRLATFPLYLNLP